MEYIGDVVASILGIAAFTMEIMKRRKWISINNWVPGMNISEIKMKRYETRTFFKKWHKPMIVGSDIEVLRCIINFMHREDIAVKGIKRNDWIDKYIYIMPEDGYVRVVLKEVENTDDKNDILKKISLYLFGRIKRQYPNANAEDIRFRLAI